jgi:DNA-binding GntR family transcriptional regulator
MTIGTRDVDDFELKVVGHPTSLRHLVQDKLRAAIAWGRFRPGQRLVERELCELTGVGRTSIREALRQLEAEGMVITVPNRGPVVSTIHADEAAQLYEERALLEGHAGRMFAERCSEADIAALAEALARFEKAASGNDKRELIEAKTRFYAVLTQGCGNTVVQNMLVLLHNRITLLRAISMSEPGRIGKSIEELRAIWRAVAARDGAAAERACAHHVAQAARVALAVLARDHIISAEERAPSLQGDQRRQTARRQEREDDGHA